MQGNRKYWNIIDINLFLKCSAAIFNLQLLCGTEWMKKFASIVQHFASYGSLRYKVSIKIRLFRRPYWYWDVLWRHVSFFWHVVNLATFRTSAKIISIYRICDSKEIKSADFYLIKILCKFSCLASNSLNEISFYLN